MIINKACLNKKTIQHNLYNQLKINKNFSSSNNNNYNNNKSNKKIQMKFKTLKILLRNLKKLMKKIKILYHQKMIKILKT